MEFIRYDAEVRAFSDGNIALSYKLRICDCVPSYCFHRHYLPVLKGYPAKYIFEPWTAPIDVQRAAKCIIGKNYPPPMCNHAEVARINMERMRLVCQHMCRVWEV